MTASLGWGLAHSSALLGRFVERVAPGVGLSEPPAIELQKNDGADGGFTDIELLAPELHVIVEAKVGWKPLNRVAAPSLRRPLREDHCPGQAGRGPYPRTARSTSFDIGWAPGRRGPRSSFAVVGWSDLVSMATLAARVGPRSERDLAIELATCLRGTVTAAVRQG